MVILLVDVGKKNQKKQQQNSVKTGQEHVFTRKVLTRPKSQFNFLHGQFSCCQVHKSLPQSTLIGRTCAQYYSAGTLLSFLIGHKQLRYANEHLAAPAAPAAEPGEQAMWPGLTLTEEPGRRGLDRSHFLC